MTLPLLPLLLYHVPDGLEQALRQEGIPCVPYGTAQGKFVLFDSQSRRRPPVSPDQQIIDVHPLRMWQGVNPFAALTDERSRRCRWRIAGLDVIEEVARYDKAAIRRKLLAQLRARVEQAGGLWLRVAAYPFPYRSAFNLRIDYDQYDPDDFERMLAKLARHGHATSHYVCGSSYENHPEPLSQLAGWDVGSHGYWHHTYTELEANLKNIARGIETLRKHGLEPSGFVAPHGRYNPGLAEALAELEITHTSEFGFAYDEFPLWPQQSRTLQVPVHPICLGVMLDAGGRRQPPLPGAQVAALLSDYFQRVAHAKYEAGEPLFFYGHPTGRLGRYPQVVESLLKVADNFTSLWQTTLSEFQQWWRLREKIQVEVFRHGDRCELRAENLPSQYRLAVEYCRGPHMAVIPLENGSLTFAPRLLVFQRRPRRPVPELVRFETKSGLRERVLRMVDFERETPLDEIEVRTWRSWMKRTLRKVRPNRES